MNQARIRLYTRKPLLRLFYVGVALVLRNLWVWLHLMLLSQPQRGGRQLRLDKLQIRTMSAWLVRLMETIYDVPETAPAYLPPGQ